MQHIRLARAWKQLPLVAVVGAFVLLSTAQPAHTQSATKPYPTMAPLAQYLMPDRNAEIALARTAAPDAISHDAEVLVLGRHGYERGAPEKGNGNGFVCLVQRSFAAGIEASEFWNPKIRSPICLNPAAVRSVLPRLIAKTNLALAGHSTTQMAADLDAAFRANQLSAVEPGAMSYMLSKQAYLNDRDGNWHPHIMFFEPQTADGLWGANVHDSPIIAASDAHERLTILLIPVDQWSDGTLMSKVANK